MNTTPERRAEWRKLAEFLALGGDRAEERPDMVLEVAGRALPALLADLEEVERERDELAAMWAGVAKDERAATERALAERDAAIARAERAEAALVEARVQRDSMPAQILDQCRGIQGEPCKDCGGWGVKTYGSTATWRGGIGGQVVTDGVCNRCWGSGDAAKPWPSWRRAERIEAELDAAKSGRLPGDGGRS